MRYTKTPNYDMLDSNESLVCCRSVVQQAPGSDAPTNQPNPYRLNTLLTKYEDEYPLRKTGDYPLLRITHTTDCVP